MDKQRFIIDEYVPVTLGCDYYQATIHTASNKVLTVAANAHHAKGIKIHLPVAANAHHAKCIKMHLHYA